MAVVLECVDLDFTYKEKPVLHHVSFSVETGQFCAVLGRNGSGKSTLIHCLNRILPADSGEIRIMGKNINHCTRKQIARYVSLVPQEHIDIFPYSVLDVVVMGRAPFLKTAERPGPADYETARNALDVLNAGYLAAKNFNRISGGERRITLLARALAQAGHLMLLDEPTNHLDFNNQYRLLSAIKGLCQKKQLSVVASMHDPNMAAIFADQVVMLKNGRVIKSGSAQTLMTARNITELYDTDTGSVALDDRMSCFFPRYILEK